MRGLEWRDVFEPYKIVSEADLTAAADRLHMHLQRQRPAARVMPLKAVKTAS